MSNELKQKKAAIRQAANGAAESFELFIREIRQLAERVESAEDAYSLSVLESQIIEKFLDFDANKHAAKRLIRGY